MRMKEVCIHHVSFARYSPIRRGDGGLTTDLSHQSGHYFAHRVAKAQKSLCRPALGPTRPACVKKPLLHTFM